MPTKTILKSFSSLVFLLSSYVINAQNTYEKGYFIDNNQNKVECLIRNLDWKNNPTEFSYKKNETAEPEVGNLTNVSKFEIIDNAVYVRATVKTDLNITNSNKLNYSEQLALKENTVFLKLLVGGKINLFMYKDANSKLFYYQKGNEDITLLEYKEYINSNKQVAKNEKYKTQIWNNVQCYSIDVNKVNKTDYTQSDLMALIKDYNTCENEMIYSFQEKKRKGSLIVSIRPGLILAKTNFEGPSLGQGRLNTFDFDREVSVRFGIEVEYILPFNNNKWSLILEPTYQFYNTEKTFDTNPREAIERIETATVKYSSIELPFGFRHYNYLNANSKLFANFSVVLDTSFESKIKYGDTVYDSDTGINLAFGLGYNYKSKYSIEARLNTSRDILNSYPTLSSNYNNISVIFGYTIF